MSCAARYSETTSLKFILNPFEIFRTVKSRLMCPRKLSIFERLEGAGQRLTMIFPTGANFRPGSRSFPNAVPACWSNPSGRAYATPRLFLVFAGFSSCSTGFAPCCPALRHPQRLFIKRTSAAPVHTHSLRFVREPAERARMAHCHADVVSTRQCDFFPFYASISPSSVTCRAFLRGCRPTLSGPVASSGFPAPFKRLAMKMTRMTGCQVYTHETDSVHKKIKPPRNARGSLSLKPM